MLAKFLAPRCNGMSRGNAMYKISIKHISNPPLASCKRDLVLKDD